MRGVGPLIALGAVSLSACALVLGDFDNRTTTSTSSSSSASSSSDASTSTGTGGADGGGTGGAGAGGGPTNACDGGAACTQPSECPIEPSACVKAACTGGCCTTTFADAKTTCDDDGGKLCDGNGKCVACIVPTDCTDPGTMCATATCDGHACKAVYADKGKTCSDNGGTVCDGSGNCVAAHCNDGVVDSDETDTDCGGSCGATCKDSNPQQKCKVAGDCVSGICQGPAMALLCQAPSCSDSVMNGGETDTDCGGPCPSKCAETKHCKGNGDCVTANCLNGICTAKTNGASCGSSAECISGHACLGGACCASACVTGACGATACAAGTGACVYPGSSKQCHAPSCSGSTLTTNHCDGAGTCAGMSAPCSASFACASDTACGTSCSVTGVAPSGTSQGCAAGAYCDTTVNPAKCSTMLKSSGAKCSYNFECASNSCGLLGLGLGTGCGL